jgi:predicted AAA+ superfamily ATPase
MIQRTASKTILNLAKGYPLVAVTGPRQSGKTTLVRSTFPKKTYISLEDPDQLEYALADPRSFLARFPEGAILDEVQRAPTLFSYLQTQVDREKRMGSFILTGSQQFGLLSKITQTLAGRVGLVHLLPFSLGELQKSQKEAATLEDQLWQGFYPPLYDRDLSPTHWYGNYVATYVERDVRQILSIKELSTFQRFLRMCAARTGQLLNLSSLGNDCGITHNTAKAWLSVLEASYIVFLVYPHFKNFGKRLVKTPKLYFYDTGLASWLLNIQDSAHLAIYPQRGPLFESFIVSELFKGRFNRGLRGNLFFWRDNLGNEIDVIIEDGELLTPLECKSGQTITTDYFKGLDQWAKISGGSSGKPLLVYGGEENLHRSGTKVISWKGISQLATAL